MYKLIFEDYQKAGFGNAEAGFMAQVSERLNKTYMAPASIKQGTVIECNNITKKMMDFIESRPPEKAFSVLGSMFLILYDDLNKLSVPALHMLTAGTGLPFIDAFRPSDQYLQLMTWKKLCINAEAWTKEEISEKNAELSIHFQLIGTTYEDFKNPEDDFSNYKKGNRAVSELTDDLLLDLQERLNQTHLGGLVLPGNVINKQKNYRQILKYIQDAEVYMAEATGWGKEALGLKGRVVLAPGCLYSGNSGSCIVFNHKHKSATTDKFVYIVTSANNGKWFQPKNKEIDFLFNSLSHEWMHALDFCAEPDFLRSTIGQGELYQSLNQFNEDLETLDYQELNKPEVIRLYRQNLLDTLSAAIYRLTPRTIRAIDDLLNEPEFNQNTAEQFKQLLSHLSQSALSQWVTKFAIVHKLKFEPWTKMPYLLASSLLEQERLESGQKSYFTTRDERLAFSFQSSLNPGNPLNSSSLLFDPMGDENVLLRKKWKSLFAKHKADFKSFPQSTHYDHEPQMDDFERPRRKRDFWVELQSYARVVKENVNDISNQFGRKLSQKIKSP